MSEHYVAYRRPDTEPSAPIGLEGTEGVATGRRQDDERANTDTGFHVGAETYVQRSPARLDSAPSTWSRTITIGAWFPAGRDTLQ